MKQPATCHPYLDDPISFARELYNLLAAGGDGRIVGGKVAAYTPFNRAIEALQSALLADQPDAARLLCEVDELGINLASLEHARGVEFGVAAEQVRRGILDGATAPRIPWK